MWDKSGDFLLGTLQAESWSYSGWSEETLHISAPKCKGKLCCSFILCKEIKICFDSLSFTELRAVL